MTEIVSWLHLGDQPRLRLGFALHCWNGSVGPEVVSTRVKGQRVRNSGPKGGRATGRGTRTQAPGQFYGYSIQTTRLLARLLRAREGQAVSLEVLGDVAVTGAEGTTAEETKSGLRHNPIADRAVDLWKTLFNWLQAIRAGALSSDTRFVLYVVQPYDGKLAQALHRTTQRADATALVRRLRDDMWGVAPKFVRKAKLAPSLAPYVNGVLSVSDDLLAKLVAAFELEIGTGSPADEVRLALREKAISDGAVDHVLKYLLGWVKQTIDALIEKGRPAVISWEEFHPRLVAAAKKFDRSESLSPTSALILEADVHRELKDRTYVRQLELVEQRADDLVRAVNDYLRASADRARWSERGDVLETSFDEFEEALERHWANRRQLAAVELTGRTDAEVGRAVLVRCLDVQMKLQNMELPSYFTPGSYHALADGLAVGWHPQFRHLLSGDDDAPQISAGDDAASDSARDDLDVRGEEER